MKKLGLIVLCFTVAACAVGTKINYSEGHIPLANKAHNFKGGCSLRVIDKRPYILSGKKAPNFVGIRRGGYGNPFNVVTQSGQSLADDLTKIFAASFNIDPQSRCNFAHADFVDGSGKKELLYQLNEWKSDVMIKGWFRYDVDTTITINGEQIAKDNTKGDIVISGKFKLHSAVEKAFNEIHSTPEIAAALAK